MRLRPDVLAVVGSVVMRAIRDMTGNTPVVLLSSDPVGAGFVASLARPGGHITGVSMMQGSGGLTGKRIELLTVCGKTLNLAMLPIGAGVGSLSDSAGAES